MSRLRKREKLIPRMNIEKPIIALLMLVAVIIPCGCEARSSNAVSKPAAGGASIASGPNSTKLTWDVPQKRTDGTTLNNIKGYKVYYGMASLTYTRVVQVSIEDPALSCQDGDIAGKKKTDKRECSYVVQGLGKGSYYFAATAYDDKGNESDFSNEVSKQFK